MAVHLRGQDQIWRFYGPIIFHHMMTISFGSLLLKGIKDCFQNAPALFDHDPMEVVDMALHQLQNCGVQPVEWRSRLYLASQDSL